MRSATRPLASNQRIWGFESNFGGLPDLALVKANQLMPKPVHLTWEEAACNALCNSTSYRMIVSTNGSQMTQGQAVLVWGATGGIGAYATQYVLNGGGTPVGVVSSERRAELLRELGCEAVIDRRADDYKFWNADDTEQDPAEWLRFGKKIRSLIGRPPAAIERVAASITPTTRRDSSGRTARGSSSRRWSARLR